ncbi:hypothetical protein Emag_003701 [Eimeria magna]
MVLTLVGLGLHDERDVTVRGLSAVREADFVYLESYTSILNVDASRLERFFGKPIIQADRDFVEKQADAMLDLAKAKRVACLVVGDPFWFMSVATAIKQLLEAEEEKKAGENGIANALAFGLARIGADDEAIVSGTLQELAKADLGGPLHSLVVCAPELHEIEEEFVRIYRLQ